MENKALEYFKEKLKDIKDEKEKVTIASAVAFAKENKNCLIMICDVRSDDMVAAYKDKFMAARIMKEMPIIPIKTKTGLVKEILLGHGKTKKRENDINQFTSFLKEFLWQVSDKIGTPLENAMKQRKELDERSENKSIKQ